MMRQKATVTRLLSEHRAELMVARKSACSGDCHSCGGCTEAQLLRLEAQDAIGVQKGDVVYVESDGGVVLKGAVLLYVLPLLLFLAAYLAAGDLGGWAFAIGAGAFVLGLLPALLYDRYVKNHPPEYTIVAFVE